MCNFLILFFPFFNFQVFIFPLEICPNQTTHVDNMPLHQSFHKWMPQQKISRHFYLPMQITNSSMTFWGGVKYTQNAKLFFFHITRRFPFSAFALWMTFFEYRTCNGMVGSPGVVTGGFLPLKVGLLECFLGNWVNKVACALNFNLYT